MLKRSTTQAKVAVYSAQVSPWKMEFVKFLLLAAAMFSVFALRAQDDLINKVKANQSANAAAKFQFTPIKDIEATEVKDQGSSGTCWSYCSISFLESEMKRIGKKPVDLAEMFIVRNQYIDKAEVFMRMHGSSFYGQGGALHDVIDMYGKYGILPQEVYSGLNYGTTRNNFSELEAVLTGFLKGLSTSKVKKLSPVWKDAFTKVVDSYLGEVPAKFTFEGKEYTPKTFAEQVVGLNAADYIELSSFTNAPYYQKTPLLVPDNWNYSQVYNVKMDELTEIVDHAIHNGYTVSWATDVSEKGFSWKNGVAYVLPKDFDTMTEEEKAIIFEGPQPEGVVTAERRQMEFDDYTTTDDHGMQITGIYKDQNGKEYYKVKNSWGAKNDHQGYLYATKNFLKLKTTAILLHKDGIPKGIRSKCDIK